MKRGRGGLRAVLTPTLAGALMGAAHLSPAAAPLTWVGLTLFAASLARIPQRRWRPLAVLTAAWASMFVSQIWLGACFAGYGGPLLPEGDVPLWLGGAAWAAAALIPATHRALPVALGAVLLRRPPLRFWLPGALLVGEALSGALGFTLGDLMYAQGSSPWVLRSVALVGLPITTLIALYAAVALGEALARREPWGGAAALPVLLWFGALPALPPVDDALVGVAAVHMADFEARPDPRGLGAGIDLVVWPEASLRGKRRLEEGEIAPPLPLEALKGWEGARHVVSLGLASRRGALNGIGVTDPWGAVTAVRGKSSLTPWGERPYGGLDPLGVSGSLPRGEAPPVLWAGATALIATLCYEVYERALFLEGDALGGALIVNIANDRAYGPTELGIRQAIGVLALRAAELGRPAVRASLWGHAAILSSTGAVLAVSPSGPSGLLTWGGGRPVVAEGSSARRPGVVILSDKVMPSPFECRPPGCVSIPIAEFDCARAPREVETVVLSGHSLPPSYLGQAPAVIADAVACMEPSLIVLDTCYGFSSPLLEALARGGQTPLVVGPRAQVAEVGLSYGPAFFRGPSAEERADAVGIAPGRPVETWRVDAAELRAAQDLSATWDPDQLTARLRRVHPNLVNVPLGGDATVLVPIPPERFGR